MANTDKKHPFYALELSQRMSDYGPDWCEWSIIEEAEKELARLCLENRDLKTLLLTIKNLAENKDGKYA